jgi:hypothetical protein
MVDALGRSEAILATVPVATEHRPARHRDAALIGNVDEVGETYHRRHPCLVSLRTPDFVPEFDGDRLATNHEHHRPSVTHDRQRFVTRIEN